MAKQTQKENTPKPISSATTTVSKSSFDYTWLLFGIAMLLLFLLRNRFVSMPLERDEGEYAYMGSLILKGIAPYQEAFNMKLPGTNIMYAVIMLIFGQTYTGIHLGLLVFNLATVAFLFLALKKLFNFQVGLSAAFLYGFMSISPNYLGFAAHATHFVSFFGALGLFFLVEYKEKLRFTTALYAGLSFGMAFLCKQQAVFLIVGGGIGLLILSFELFKSQISKIIINALGFGLGVFVPYLLIVLWVSVTGNFDKFWFWTVQYASKYASGVSFEEGKVMFDMVFKPMWEEYKIVYIFMFLGIVTTIIGKYAWQTKALILILFIASFLTIVPGFYFRQHYFISWLPYVAIMAVLFTDYLTSLLKFGFVKWAIPILFGLVVIMVLNGNKMYYSKMKPEPLHKMIYGANPFAESIEIANYIKKNSSPTDKIAVLGSEPQIMLYSGLKSATGHIYTYGMMEIHDYNIKMQEEMISDIEREKPLYVVYANVRFSWLPRPESPMKIFEWYNSYIRKNYEVVGLIDMTNPQQSQYWWDESAKDKLPQGQEFLLVYKRNALN